MKEIVKVSLFSKDTEIFEIYDELCKGVGRTTFLTGVPEPIGDSYEWLLPFPTIFSAVNEKEKELLDLLLTQMFINCRIKEAWVGEHHLAETKALTSTPNYHAIAFMPNTETTRDIVRKIAEPIGVVVTIEDMEPTADNDTCFMHISVEDEYVWDEHIDAFKSELNWLLVSGILSSVSFYAKARTAEQSNEKEEFLLERMKEVVTSVVYDKVAPLRSTMMTEYGQGRKHGFELVIATLIGWQNEMGHNKPKDPEYKAYQRVIEEIIDMQKRE